MNKKNIVNPTPQNILEIISKDYPEFEVARIEVLENAHGNYVYLLNDSHVFRFPRRDSLDFEREINLLEMLKNKISISIPFIKYIGKEYKYMGYKKLEGINLSKPIYKSLSLENSDKLAFDIAQFISEMQASITVEEAKWMNFKKLELKNDSTSELRKILENTEIDKKTIDLYIEYLDKHRPSELKDEDQRVVHRDLVNNNILIDPINGHLSAVLDFGNAGYGNLYLDFVSVYRNNKTLCSKVVEIYNSTYSANVSLDLVKTFSFIVEINHLKTPDDLQYKRANIRLNAWVSEII